MPKALHMHIMNHPPGGVFSAMNFLDLAPRNTIDQTLLRLAKARKIVKVATGLFCIPKNNPILGVVKPNIDDIVKAYAHKFGYKIQIHPAKAANLLGLSQQIPAQHSYLTDGPSRNLIFSGTNVVLKHVCQKKLIGIGTKAGVIIQALYYLGAESSDQQKIDKLRSLVDATDKVALKDWLNLVPAWMQQILKYVIYDA